MAGYPVENGGERIVGRGEHDHERLFPKFTTAQAASTGEVTINGKTLKMWEFSQLENLKPAVLKQRAMAIRDAVGEASCPPMPSAQKDDMIRWIMHMQAALVDKDIEVHRNAMQGSGPPPSFMQESQDRPIRNVRAVSPSGKPLPFGPRKLAGDIEAQRDHFGEILATRGEFKEAEAQGVGTLRAGGEGRRHIYPRDNMVNNGVSVAEQRGIESMKEMGEGRRYIGCQDNLFVQQKELEGIDRGEQPESRRPRQGPESMRCGGQGMARIMHLDEPDTPVNRDPINEQPIGGDRKKHLSPEDHMLNHGTADAVEATIGHGRKHIDTFAGRTQMSGASGRYKPTWKQDPSRLMGTSLII